MCGVLRSVRLQPDFRLLTRAGAVRLKPDTTTSSVDSYLPSGTRRCVRADSRAASRISVTIRLFSSDDSAFG